MSEKTCAWMDCSKPILPKGQIYNLFGQPGIDYCSRECVEKAHAKWMASKKASEKTPMQHLAEEFEDAGVIRRFCDRCKTPITLCWKGRNGEYCSNSCLKLSEKQGETKVSDTETNTAATTTAAPPITAGSSKKKPVVKKTVKPAKPAPAVKSAPAAKPVPAAKTKVAAPAPDVNGRSKFADDAAIKVLKTDHTLKGKRGESLDALLKSATVEKFRAALAKKDLVSYAGFAIKTAIDSRSERAHV